MVTYAQDKQQRMLSKISLNTFYLGLQTPGRLGPHCFFLLDLVLG